LLLEVVNSITAVDGDFGCVKFIKQVAPNMILNIAATKSDVSIFERNNATYDIIFADPPYALTKLHLKKIVMLVFEKKAT
jgi:16S rRNA G966 N2-methylase RsmD